MGPPDKVKDVTPAKLPTPLTARPLNGPVGVGPVIVIRGFPPFPEKVMVPVVGADRVTLELEALAVSGLSTAARVKTAKITIDFRIFVAPM